MICRRWLIAAVACASLAGRAALAADAPFGLEWGMSVQAAEALGIKLQAVKTEDNTKGFTAQDVPKILGDVERVQLDFGYNDKLRKITAISRSFKSDPYGHAVLARYNQLLELLEGKYGRGKSNHKKGDSIYAEPRYFLSGIRSGNSWHYTTLEADGISVELSVRSQDGDTGYWVLIYENKALAKEVEEEKRRREKNSL